jgi:NAD(P)-dependent dehydrogenase (short-subunit alcohol dehydrogenase family)
VHADAVFHLSTHSTAIIVYQVTGDNVSSSFIQDRTVLVTGSTDGIGLQTALDLARLGGRVILHGRTEERLHAAMMHLRRANAEIAGAVTGDFSSIASMGRMIAELRDSFPELSVLVNNAGVYMSEHVMTEDGYEMTWQVNHLAMMLLTEQLLLTLKDNMPARVVNVSSIAHTRGSIAFDNLNGEREYDAYGAYAQSKLANVLFTYELAAKLHGSGVSVNCLHPGVIGTKLLRDGFGIDGASVEEGAATSVYLASADDVSDVSGKYFVRKQQTPSSATSYDLELMRRLWDVSERQIQKAVDP